MPPLIRPTEQGLFCPAGGFHIDPWKPVERALITHAHSDHACPGSASYLCSVTGAAVLQARLGASISVQTLDWGRPLRLGDVEVRLSPAGHILGSVQIRVERVAGIPEPGEGGVWVVSGDYKFSPEGRADPTCEPFEPVRCDTFLTESTFGLPIYRWPSDEQTFREINAWWASNAADGTTSILYSYSLGKAQRLLAGLDASIGPIAAHGSVLPLNQAYASQGIALPTCTAITRENLSQIKGRGLVIAPPSAAGNAAWVRKLAGRSGFSDAFASGWMRVRGKRRWRSFDRGFVVSDHADWQGLLAAIQATGAQSIGVTHGYSAALSRWLAEHGRESFVVPTRFEGEALPGASSGADAGDAPEGGAT